MNTNRKTTIVIADLGYGDAGKGSIVDALTRSQHAHTVVRYNGGAQAAHNVVTRDGHQHTFAQFGSGTLVPGTRTHLSRFMLLHPLAMLAEEQHLRTLGVGDAFERTSIERGALVITPFQQAANRLKELARGDQRHGSCGLGIGETMSDGLALGAQSLTAGDLRRRDIVIHKLCVIRDRKLDELGPVLASLANNTQAKTEQQVLLDPNMVEMTADIFTHFASLVKIVGPEFLGNVLAQDGTVIFEGAQGVLLDEWWGFPPYNTWSTLTFEHAETLLSENRYDGDTVRLGLLRGYATRHGAGPFVSEDAGLTARLPDAHNSHNPWQRDFRVGHLDLLALRYALSVVGRVDGLVVTNLDRMEAINNWSVCDRYHYPGDLSDLENFVDNEDQLVSAIHRPQDPTDLPRQERLTRLLMQMQPILTEWPRNRHAYLARIGDALGVPVVMTSAGETAAEKAILQQLPSSAATTLAIPGGERM